MHAIIIDPVSHSLEPISLPLPIPRTGEVCIRVAFAGVNHADLLQVQGRYPHPASTNNVPGLEVSGVIEAVGEGVDFFHTGNRVCALLEGGGYAEYVIVNASLCLLLPDTISLEVAACLPEAMATSCYALIFLAQLQAKEHVLITGGASGVGSIALQLARYCGAITYTTASSQKKADYCRSLGAHIIAQNNATIEDFAQHQKMDVVMDMAGGEIIGAYLKLLRYGGRLISIACMDDAKVAFSMSGLLMKNLRWMGMTLRSQSLQTKAEIIDTIRTHYMAAIGNGEITPTIDCIFTLGEAQKAHAYMEMRNHIGKILLKV